MSVGVGPFLVVDDARRQRLQLEVGHAVRADNHGAAFPAELVDNGLEGRRTAVQSSLSSCTAKRPQRG